MIIERDKLKLADAFLALLMINNDSEQDLPHKFWVEAYSNGREQGYCLSGGMGFKIAFSEYRNSDSLVIYVGKYQDFDMQGNVPSEIIYKTKQFFAPDKLQDAVSFVEKKMEQYALEEADVRTL